MDPSASQKQDKAPQESSSLWRTPPNYLQLPRLSQRGYLVTHTWQGHWEGTGGRLQTAYVEFYHIYKLYITAGSAWRYTDSLTVANPFWIDMQTTQIHFRCSLWLRRWFICPAYSDPQMSSFFPSDYQEMIEHFGCLEERHSMSSLSKLFRNVVRPADRTKFVLWGPLHSVVWEDPIPPQPVRMRWCQHKQG